MPIDWTEHARVSVETLGESVLYTPAGGTQSTVTGIYREAAQDDVDVQSTAPTVECMAEDLPDLAEGAAFVIREVSYTGLAPKYNIVRGTVLVPLEKA